MKRKNLITFIIGGILATQFLYIGYRLDDIKGNPVMSKFVTGSFGDFTALLSIVMVIVGITLIVISVIGFMKGDKGKQLSTDNINVVQKEKPINEDTQRVKNAVQQLKEYKELLDSGILTQEEFNRKKEQLLE